jgi:hypothetical protein
MSFNIKRPWTQQPSIGQIDWGSPFALGLVDGYNSQLRRHIAAAKPTSANTSQLATVVANAAAVLRKGSGSSSYIQLPSANIAGLNKIQITLPIQITSQNGEMILEQSASADSNIGFYVYGLNASSLRIQSNTGSASFQDPSYTFPSYPVVMTLRADISSSTHLYEVWVNGERVVLSGLGTSSGTFVSNDLNIGNRNAGSLSSDGAFGDLFIHRGWMDDTLLRQWHKNIWSIYKPVQIIIPTATAGGYTHPTLSNARMGSMTGTGGIPQVNYTF